MLPVLITIDTEYSPGLYQDGSARDREENFRRTIACRNSGGECGIFYQMDLFDRHGITASFFVDPLPALIWGQEAIDAVVAPIVERGHEVQLHLHPEWLEFAGSTLIGGRTGRNMRDFSIADQAELLDFGCARLVEAGAPRPTAFRAGNYGANDDTLRALAKSEMAFDTSFPAGLPSSECDISMHYGNCAPVDRSGVTEIPVSAIAARGSELRHGQLAALSWRELRDALDHAAQTDWPAFVLVSHSFELFDRNADKGLGLLKARFERLCEFIATDGRFAGVGFENLQLPTRANALPILPYRGLRTVERMAQQFLVNYLRA